MLYTVNLSINKKEKISERGIKKQPSGLHAVVYGGSGAD